MAFDGGGHAFKQNHPNPAEDFLSLAGKCSLEKVSAVSDQLALSKNVPAVADRLGTTGAEGDKRTVPLSPSLAPGPKARPGTSRCPFPAYPRMRQPAEPPPQGGSGSVGSIPLLIINLPSVPATIIPPPLPPVFPLRPTGRNKAARNRTNGSEHREIGEGACDSRRRAFARAILARGSRA